jgi:hypothetical protein
MGFLSKAFKKVKPKSMAREASGKMGKGLLERLLLGLFLSLKNQSGRSKNAVIRRNFWLIAKD